MQNQILFLFYNTVHLLLIQNVLITSSPLVKVLELNINMQLGGERGQVKTVFFVTLLEVPS